MTNEKPWYKKWWVWTITLFIFFGIYVIADLRNNSSDSDTAPAQRQQEEIVSFIDLDSYYSGMDYSCNIESDCEIKDVHNCCGYYPECVNKHAKTDPDFVKRACDIEGVDSVCGYPSINGCECEANKCKCTFSNE